MMAYKHYRMDTTFMSVEHRDELLLSIRKLTGIGWPNWTGEPFIFKLTWDVEYDFEQLVAHASECDLTPWETF